MTHSGQLDGVVTDHKKTAISKNVGKSNETTPEEQAISDALSDYRSKLDEGYKSLSSLGIDEKKLKHPLIKVLEERLPKFNSDASGNVKPMLAPSKPWKAGDKKNKYPKIMEPKLDGLRSTVLIQENNVVVLSRSGKPYPTLGHIEKAIMAANLPAGIILDGEIYKHGWGLQEINRAVKKYRKGITEQLEFWVYDLASSKELQEVRSNEVRAYVQAVGAPLLFATSIGVKSDKDVQTMHDTYVKNGYEGGMLKDLDGTYQPGQRSSFWQKVKMFDDDEYKIVGYELGERGVEDLMFVCESPKGSTSEPTFKAKMKGSRETKYELFVDMQNLIGKQLTVKHFGFTEYGIPNLPTGKAIRDYE